MSVLGLVLLAASAFTGFAVATSLLMAATRRTWLLRLEAMEPDRRAGLLTAASLGPLLAGLGLTALCFAPKLLDPVLASVDHCTVHGGGHAHFCLSHLPAAPGSTAAWLVVIGALVALLTPAVAQAARAVRSRRLIEMLLAGGVDSEGVHVVPAAAPLALSTGLLRRRILISGDLVASLSPPLLAAVVAHERAHHRRRDVLRTFVAALAATLHLPSTRRELLASLELAVEQASDDEAAAAVGDRLVVARALLAVERLAHTPSHALLGARMGGSTVSKRVEALLSPPVPASSRAPVRLLAALLLLAAALVADPLHHVAETLFGFMAGM